MWDPVGTGIESRWFIPRTRKYTSYWGCGKCILPTLEARTDCRFKRFVKLLIKSAITSPVHLSKRNLQHLLMICELGRGRRRDLIKHFVQSDHLVITVVKTYLLGMFCSLFISDADDRFCYVNNVVVGALHGMSSKSLNLTYSIPWKRYRTGNHNRFRPTSR